MASHIAPSPDPNPDQLLAQVDELLIRVVAEAQEIRGTWPAISTDFDASASNLAAYLAFRRHDLQALQRSLMTLGLSSLGRIESRVIPSLVALKASLAAIVGNRGQERPATTAFFEGETTLARRSDALLGSRGGSRPVGLLVTCPSEAADDPGFMKSLAERHVEAVRINCAHDDATAWRSMIDHARAAEGATGHRMRVLMDLGGPKIRTGPIDQSKASRLNRGDAMAIALPGALRSVRADFDGPSVECTLAEAVRAARPAQHVLYDDGKIDAVVESMHSWGILLKVERCPEKGVRLKPEKGLNFPDTDFHVEALTKKDLEDLDFIANNADGIEYSFVQSPEDVVRLQNALAKVRPDWQKLWLVLKIETASAVTNLPKILVQAASRQPTAIMIARGDLAVEIGFGRTAEMQEELLWLAEAAHTPVIWATQVLEQLVTKGKPARGEMTDAAMAARAECVMLNKGPHLLVAIDTLDVILRRMSANQYKKTPKLRPLHSWSG
jgi:pyruvate kinase